jgi:hypothetical protein
VDLLPANNCLSRREGCEATDAARNLLQGRSGPGCDMYQCLQRRTVCCGTRCDAEGENGRWQRWGRTNAKPNSWCAQHRSSRRTFRGLGGARIVPDPTLQSSPAAVCLLCLQYTGAGCARGWLCVETMPARPSAQFNATMGERLTVGSWSDASPYGLPRELGSARNRSPGR